MTIDEKREKAWSSRIGFILAVSGSAVGLANIWKFPFTVGESGGATFILLYLLALALIGFPVLLSELILGKTTQAPPDKAFAHYGGKKMGRIGLLTILTGLIVSGFYSAIAGWILGYFIESLRGALSSISTVGQAVDHYHSLTGSPLWAMSCHILFASISSFILYFGIQSGIERASKYMMPLLLLILLLLSIRGLFLPKADEALLFLFTPSFDLPSKKVLLAALGQAFFTLSLGQGTMVTYGSYLKAKGSLLKLTLPVVLIDTAVSLLAAIAVFTTAFSAGIKPHAGESLLFETIPLAFNQLHSSTLLPTSFFLLVLLAAITSEISAMEPFIAYLEERGWSRKGGVRCTAALVILVGMPSALANAYPNVLHFFGHSLLQLTSFLMVEVAIPLGGLAAVLLVGWKMKQAEILTAIDLPQGKNPSTFLRIYLKIVLRFIAPLLVLYVFFNALFGY